VIDAEFGKEDHGSIPATAIGMRLEPLDVRTDPRIGLGSPIDQIQVVKKKIKNTTFVYNFFPNNNSSYK
jgi:hypothetical protein